MYGHGRRFRVRRQPFAGPDRVSRTGPAEAKRKAATRKAGRHGLPAGKSEYAAEPETPLLFRFLRDVRTAVRPETVLAPVLAVPATSNENGDGTGLSRREQGCPENELSSDFVAGRDTYPRPRRLADRRTDAFAERPPPTGCPHPSPRTIRPTAEKYPCIYG